MITLFIFLIAAHLFGDVIVRPPIVHSHKGKSSLVLLFHCYTWASIVALPIWYFNSFHVWKFLFLLIGHFAIDKFKFWVDPDHCWLDEDRESIQINKWVVIDQLLHLLQLVVVLL